MFEDNNLNNMKSYKIARKTDEDAEKDAAIANAEEASQEADDTTEKPGKKGKKKEPEKKASKWVLVADLILVILSGAASVFLFYEIATRAISKEFIIMLAITLFLGGTGIFDFYLNIKSNSGGKSKKKKSRRASADDATTYKAPTPNKPKPKKSGKSYGANKKHKKH